MPSVEIEIGTRRYQVACRAGEEDHLRAVAAIVDQKARDAAGALGALGETRQLLIAALLLADQLSERDGEAPAPPPSAQPAAEAGAGAQDDPAVADALERLAERMERLASRLETGGASPYIAR
ncbi:cell division protein ZapA [Sphingomonas parva]|uniref:Cell division protein ZapA n=1 Tax=Sphingomonas parva TaxID=2555898 RepID=A0A4Y8ZN22_9SPHN|nr:cell division protein ZapA [Sphingomonas parva]TFI57400.1 cell division protein ZapA [Sphingomonas parva]